MTRQKTRRQPWLLIGSGIILTVVILTGAVFLLLPKITAASANQSTVPKGQTGSAATTIKSTANTSNVGQIAIQPTPAATSIPQTGSNTTATGNGNSTNPMPTTTTNANPTATVSPTQNITVSLVMLKQYVPNIRHMVAQSFNITDKELALQLQQGMHLKDIAMGHGLSDTQLQNLLSSSIASGFQPAINVGSLTQAQVASFIQQTQQNPMTLEQQLSILPAPIAHW